MYWCEQSSYKHSISVTYAERWCIPVGRDRSARTSRQQAYFTRQHKNTTGFQIKAEMLHLNMNYKLIKMDTT